MIRIGIVGAGRGGSALLELFSSSGGVRVTGITDQRKDAPGFKVAHTLGVEVFDDISGISATTPDIVVNATGDRGISEVIRKAFAGPIEIIDGRGAKLLWELVEGQRQAKSDLDALYNSGAVLAKSKHLKDALDSLLESAISLTKCDAGFILLVNGAGLSLAAARGIDEKSLSGIGRDPAKLCFASEVLSGKEAVSVEDLSADAHARCEHLGGSGASSILAVPLKKNGTIVGILYLTCSSIRRFTDRHTGLVKLFSTQAAHSIERFRLQHDLEESLAKLQGVLDDSEDMIIAADTGGKITQFSKGGERILGYAQEEAIGKNVAEFYLDKSHRHNIVRELKEKGLVVNRETVLVSKDSRHVDISLTMSQLRDEDGAVIGTVGVSKDITEEKRLKRELEELNRSLEIKVLERTSELEQANRELIRANEMKGRFIANASHELRTPLHSIIGFAEVLLKKSFGDLNERQTKFVSTVLNSGNHLLHLVNNILDLAKIEAGRAQLSCESFPVRHTVDEVVSVIKPLSDRKRQQVEVASDASVDDFVADKIKFKQILYNLVSNAVKFTPDLGRIDLTAIRLVNDGELKWAPRGVEFLKVSVRDTGKGILPEDREKVFEEFEQLDASKSTEGTGLGLSLTKKLVELHGGHIEIGGAIQQGAVFNVYLPYMLEGDGAGRAIRFDSKDLDELDDGTQRPLVLVVEDDLPTVELLTIHLAEAGYNVAHAFDGEEAVRKARELRPFVITLDIMLPKKDGWEVLQELKGSADTRDIPVIIHSMIENTELGFALGATDYLVKPADHTALVEKLKSLCVERSRYKPLNILAISGDEGMAGFLKDALREAGCVFNVVSDGREGVSLAIATRPSAIIVDADDEDKCVCVIDKLKKTAVVSEIPIFVIASADRADKKSASLAGFVEKILSKDTLHTGEFVDHIKSLEILYPERAGLIDETTALFNRKYLRLRLRQELSRSARYGQPIVFLLLSLDNFDSYVSINGEYYGNLTLKKAAELLARSVRGSDIMVRYAQSCFGVVLTNTPMDTAQVLIKRFLSTIRDYPFLHEDVMPGGSRITASIGATAFKGQGLYECIAEAEVALRRSRMGGGNKVEISGGADAVL